MATDYDAPRRRSDDDIEADSLEGLKAQESASSTLDDDDEMVDSFEIPTADLTGEELNVSVVPRRDDEFTCSSCFIVQRKKRIDHVEDDGSIICMDCA
ncbi:DUF4193 domain-containing protein [Corynebacterium sp. ES2794-CONJ1]|uniref:DUF4193 domain-containing protein n=1 Tax=unclassified Corynebacterium TaxID=2624378 RepID=UPI0021696609|nr:MULTISPECIES: DUF4193 domain-containing protein [unclassified Corynebacterium]MCS4489198.1 DUF4193 domain-containing protein [Corynebacterium sp. ES2775-CONJ]MCS4491011.1 DUF4193 domain-containing protein [Corynebacterium sp. ES2715-CONJ3]MCS4531108.1 DUF4193 domain-containing protein [Corynebacterium sp. ES2730-CONJ]MCU9518475.1 DUF4193 domain-containing protein [Corynebacterium sp. ES2794-CONJ1]